MLPSTRQSHVCFAVFQPNTVNPETIFVEVLDHLMAWWMWGMIGGAECHVCIIHMRLCYLSNLPRGCIKWTDHIWLLCNSLNEEFVMEAWFPIMSCLRAYLVVLQLQERLRWLTPCPYSLSQANHREMVWVLQWSWTVKMKLKRMCLLFGITRRPSGFSFVLNSDCAAFNWVLSIVMSLFSQWSSECFAKVALWLL